MSTIFHLDSNRAQELDLDLSDDGEEKVAVKDHVEEVDEPVCSVLITSIDHIMCSPSPLDSQEFGDDSCEVPVMRIFGPIIRRDARRLIQEPYQSACLYVHGAFPYILVRPMVAGPDGSIHQSAHLKQTQRSEDSVGGVYTDWDSVEAVGRIVPILQQILEDTIQSSMIGFGGEESTNTKKAGAHTKRVIRQIRVVLGRGFYTYCPGSPAPFLRVEYYDPSQRWRIKATIERGLDVPLVYHPDPLQYQASVQRGQGHEEEDGGALRFHCYEAHIPYTMQFFKDWNLAGSSYIHLSRGLFRCPLPASSRQRWHGQEEIQQSFLFLDSNTPCEMLWEGPEPATEIADFPSKESAGEESSPLLPISALQQESQSSDSGLSPSFSPGEELKLLSPPQRVSSNHHPMTISNQAGPWSMKATSCDVELDVSVHDILNVHDVIKEVQERGHWRAVPSLREIWSEERRRMAKLLGPQDDFLSYPEETDKQLSFTLSVKDSAALPGARLAREGMQRLIQVTEGLEEDLHRVMSDIVERHKEDVIKVDNILHEHTSRQQRRSLQTNTGIPQQSPTDDEAMLALEQLEGLFNGGVVPSHRQSQQSLESSNRSQSSLSYHHPTSQGPAVARRRSADERFKVFSQAYYSQEKLSQLSSELGDFELSQRVDRGESVVDGPFAHVDDFIDPTTLTPFEIIDEEDESDDEDMDESALEHKLMMYATQTLRESREESAANNLPSSLNPISNILKDDSSSDDQGARSAEPEGSCDSVEEAIPSFTVPETDTISEPRWLHPADIRIERRERPPTRKEMIGPSSSMLLPAQPHGSQPSWMAYTSAYEQLRLSSGGANDWFPFVRQSGIDICLTRPAPTRKTVSSWSQRELKRFVAENEEENASSKRTKLNGIAKAPSGRLDENSHKLVFDVSPEGQVVEEVEWRSGQHITSQTQNSQEDKETPSVPKGKAKALDEAQDYGAVSLQTLSRSPVSESCGKSPNKPLKGIGNQGGRLLVEGGGQLKAKTRPSQGLPTKNGDPLQEQKHKSPYLTVPVSLMTIEVHVQCRTGRAGPTDSREIAMTPDSDRDKVFAVVYLYGRDPGGGDSLQVLERGCIFVPVTREVALAESVSSSPSSFTALAGLMRSSLPNKVMGYSAPITVECVRDERQLLLRLASIVRWKDPDILLSWDTQGAGLGYLIERGIAMGKGNGSTTTKEIQHGSEIDMARLLGRTPTVSSVKQYNIGDFSKNSQKESTPAREGKGDANSSSRWKGSGLGAEWDDRVGAGSAAASIVGRLVFAAWKLVKEEVKHPNASYLQAVASAVLGERIPFHDNLKLTEWYGHNGGRERWRTLHHKLIQAATCLRLFDALDIIGRAGEAARLSGVEFSQSFPGIRGSQYKVEGVLLRALQSLNSEERGSKRGRMQSNNLSGGGFSSLSSESKSQTQSPWKARRRRALPPDQDVVADDFCQPVDRGYFFYSPSLQDANRQEALQVQALNLEPLSGHHQDPVVVCDFTALYPSLVIAYNLCYSTVCGHLEYHSTRTEMRLSGRTTGKIGPFLYPEGRTSTVLKHHMKSLNGGDFRNDRAYVAPTGTIYVAESILKGVLPQVLDEMLSTRAMLKKAAKQYTRLVPDLSPSILRQIEARQLALKYVANVTYGYTSATFSGRCAMPLLADTIVETGRRTLTNAINLANEWGRQENGRWQGAKVIYGDTDSVFVKLPGRSVQEAFRFGEEFCAAVTARNPPPVQLKLEKVYLGSILQTKKRYCGMKFESKDQKKPTFEAKGLETVRRDQCALTQKILRNCLVTLFQRGPEAVKAYMFRQWALILSGKLPVSDFILTGRVRSRYRNGSLGPVQAALARRLAEADPGRVVRHSERQPYVIVATPGVAFTLRNSVVTPLELLEHWDAYTINTAYYIKKHVNAALQRCLGLAPHNIDVDSWYVSCPKPRRRIHFWPVRRSGNSAMISSYFGSDLCSLCGRKCKYTSSDSRGGGGVVGGGGRHSKAAVCAACRRDVTESVEAAMRRLGAVQSEANDLARKCNKCNLCFEDASTFAEERRISVSLDSNNKKKKGLRALLLGGGGGSGGGGGGVVTPLANCSCIDCPTTYERHRVREAELEALALCNALDALK